MIAIDQAGSGTPLVLLHGIGANRAIWHRVMPHLAREHLVLTPDLPGFGGSAAVGSCFDLRLTAIALADGLARRTAEPFDLLGNSLGGAVGRALAVERPELVRRLVLAAPAGFSPRPWPLPAAAGLAIGPAMALRRTFGAPVSALPAARSVLLPDLTGQLREREEPLGLIWGRLDRVIPISTLESIRALKPAAVVETIADAAHVPQAERPREFVAALRRVLDRR